MQLVENDLEFLRASAPVLEEYLLSDVLYFPLTGEHGRQLTGDSTRLTPGNLLLSQKRVQAAGISQAPDSGVEVLDQITRTRSRWFSRWKLKVAREIPNRLGLWTNYLNDLGEEPAGRVGDFRYNVRLRVILDLLLHESDDQLVAEKSAIQALDTRLKAKGTSGPFVWDSRLENGFPRDPYWYLYWILMG